MTYEKMEKLLKNYKATKTKVEHNKIKLETMQLEYELDGTGDKEEIEKIKLKIRLDTNTIKMIDNLLNGLTEIESKIIELFYFEKYPTWQIAEILGFTESWCFEVRKRAIKKNGSFLVDPGR